MRCSGDGTYITATDLNASYNGRYYTSSNSGTTWTAQTLSASAGNTNSVCFSRSGSIQYITWATSGNTNSVIYRSFDYGVTFTLVQGHIADGGYWRRIECDATGRFVYATRFNTISSQLFVYRSEDYGATWAQFNSPGYEDVWVSATGQFVVMITNTWTWNLAPYNGIVVAYSRDYGRQDTFGIFSLGQTSTIQTINGSGDGSVLVLGSLSITQSGFPGDGKIRVARQGQQNIQDLSVVGGTISKASGVYTLTNDIVLWASGSLITSTDTAFPMIDWSSTAGNIDLNLFNIRYEIECNWNYTASLTPEAHIHIAPNNVTAIDFATDPNTGYTAVAGVTNWTRVLSGPTYETSSGEFNQSYRDRFFCGFANQLGANLFDFRNRTILNGELMLQARPTAQSGISDTSQNERNIFNRFTCNNYSTQFVGSNWFIYSSGSGTDINNSTQRIDGTAIFSAGIYWSASFQSGINRIGLRLTDGFNTNTTRPRGAYYTYRIYRVRK